MSHKQSPNDQRSDVKNPNNPAYDQDQRNREEQRERPRDIPKPERSRD